MIKYEKQNVEKQVPVSISCDVCKKEYNCKTDFLEVQEFQSISFQAGYGSVFGDGGKFKIDICQHCFNELLGKYLVEDEE